MEEQPKEQSNEQPKLTKRHFIYFQYVILRKQLESKQELQPFLNMIPEIDLSNVSEKFSTLTFLFPSSDIPFDAFKGLCESIKLKDEDSIKFVYDVFTDFLKKIYSI